MPLKLEDDIKEAETRLEELKSRKRKLDELGDEIYVAELIHENTCHSNHTDGCGWYYSKWEDFDKLHINDIKRRFFSMAENLLSKFTKEQIIEFVAILKNR